MPSTTIFHGTCDGFYLYTASKAEMQAWIDRRKQDCKGKLLKLTQGYGTLSCCRFDENSPRREAVL